MLRMNHHRILVGTTLLCVFLFTIHLADDMTRGIEKGGLWNLTAIPNFTIWACGTLVSRERRSGYVLMLLGGLLGLCVPIAHMRGRGLGVIAKSSGGFFSSWTVIAIGVTALVSVILSIHGLWMLKRGQER
jgi:hypothetical protein